MSLNVESCKERLISTQRAYAVKELELQIDEIRYPKMKYFNWNLIIYEKDIVYDDNRDEDDYEIEVPEYHKDIALERFMVGKKKIKDNLAVDKIIVIKNSNLSLFYTADDLTEPFYLWKIKNIEGTENPRKITIQRFDHQKIKNCSFGNGKFIISDKESTITEDLIIKLIKSLTN